jgi:hypothetical protein
MKSRFPAGALDPFLGLADDAYRSACIHER